MSDNPLVDTDNPSVQEANVDEGTQNPPVVIVELEK